MSADIKFTPVEGALHDELPDFYCKYAPLHAVQMQGNLLVNYLLDVAPIEGDRKYITVDVKVQHLFEGDTTCLEGWHCDTISDPDALHHLFVIGKNRTEFKSVIFPDKMFASYGSEVEHRGPIVTVDETRFLLRVTESNVVSGHPVFRPYYPYRYRNGNVEKY